jgi:MFS superfamily sulfate permease-like transporter
MSGPIESRGPSAPESTPPGSDPGSFGLLSLRHDLPAGVVVFLVALPVCLGVALASNAPLSSGLLAGVVGGVVVGLASGSRTSVAGPTAGLTAVVASQITTLGSFRAFLAATVIAGALQVLLGLTRAGFIAAFFPSSVVKGLLAAIGIILVLETAPHVLGHDSEPLGEMAFFQADGANVVSGLVRALLDVQPGAALVGIVSVVILLFWERSELLKKLPLPAALCVVVLGVLSARVLAWVGGVWVIGPSHLVNVPSAEGAELALALFESPDWAVLKRPPVYVAGATLALVASLETLLNLQAIDRLDPRQRSSPPSRELLAQGLGNMLSGLVGGLPVTNGVVRSSVNINAGSVSHRSTVLHGLLLAGAVLFLPRVLNQIPLSCLAAILAVTGAKLVSPRLIQQMWSEGRPQFWPFLVTVVAIVLTNLLTGIVIGMCAALAFILRSNQERPVRRVLEKHTTGDVLRIELQNQVSFLNRAALERVLASVPSGGQVLIDARETDYIDPDVLDLLDDFLVVAAPARQVQVSLLGFRGRYPRVEDKILFVDHTSREVRDGLTPDRVLNQLRHGNARFVSGQRLTRDLMQQVGATALGQSPMAVVLSCIDSRTPVELIFDLGIGDVFSIRIAGNVARSKVLGSMEYAAVVAGAKLILVLGHSSCGAVGAAVDAFLTPPPPESPLSFANLGLLVGEVQKSIDPCSSLALAGEPRSEARRLYVDEVARRNVLRMMALIREQSTALDGWVREGKVAIVGGFYDIHTGQVRFFAAEGNIDRSALEASLPGEVAAHRSSTAAE